MPYSEGIYEDMNQAICFRHYWNASSEANDTIREYIMSEFGKHEDIVSKVVEAVALLEVSLPMGSTQKPFPAYPMGPDGPCYPYTCGCVAHCCAIADEQCGSNNRCDAALLLLNQAAVRMTPEAKASWRWRVLMDRAQIDAGMYVANGTAPDTRVVSAMANIRKMYHMDDGHFVPHYLNPLTPGQVACKKGKVEFV